MNFEELTDEEFDAHVNEVMTEREKRERKKTAQPTIDAIVARYIEDGGDSADLTIG